MLYVSVKQRPLLEPCKQNPISHWMEPEKCLFQLVASSRMTLRHWHLSYEPLWRFSEVIFSISCSEAWFDFATLVWLHLFPRTRDLTVRLVLHFEQFLAFESHILLCYFHRGLLFPTLLNNFFAVLYSQDFLLDFEVYHHDVLREHQFSSWTSWLNRASAVVEYFEHLMLHEKLLQHDQYEHQWPYLL